jgi:hypothetical protein
METRDEYKQSAVVAFSALVDIYRVSSRVQIRLHFISEFHSRNFINFSSSLAFLLLVANFFFERIDFEREGWWYA